jgi:hypothetical protein
MNKQQTSIEWLLDRIEDVDNSPEIWELIKDKAKEMEKQQIVDSFEIGYVNGGGVNKGEKIYHGGNYYNKTFKK